MKESQWHIVYTRPGREKKVAGLLAKKGIRTYCPLNNFRVQYGNRKKILGDPLFTSYVFVCISEQQKSYILHINGVMGFVYWFDKPAVILKEDIAAINFFLQDYPHATLEKIAVNIDEPAEVITEPLMVKKGNVMKIRNVVSKVLLSSLGYALVADTRKENSETLIYKEESRIRI